MSSESHPKRNTFGILGGGGTKREKKKKKKKCICSFPALSEANIIRPLLPAFFLFLF